MKINSTKHKIRVIHKITVYWAPLVDIQVMWLCWKLDWSDFSRFYLFINNILRVNKANLNVDNIDEQKWSWLNLSNIQLLSVVSAPSSVWVWWVDCAGLWFAAGVILVNTEDTGWCITRLGADRTVADGSYSTHTCYTDTHIFTLFCTFSVPEITVSWRCSSLACRSVQQLSASHMQGSK